MRKKALVTWGGWEGHDPQQTSALAREILEAEGFEVLYVNTLDVYTDAALMASLDLIVPVWTMAEITGEQSKALQNTIGEGCGLAGWHGGMCDSFRKDTGYQWMTGGQWVAHPGNSIRYAVNFTKKDDPTVKGLTDFDITSEQYYMHTDPGNDVLATTTFDGVHADWVKGTVMPIAWKRPWKKGRVFYTSLGHIRRDFEVPQVRELVRRGMLWAAR
ncbi:MAG: ThuA domain-containing protein [Lentisphaerae bacterium]|nr:ThuA domain-containing protein [Lentisphaerota bacterium]